MKIAVVGTGYVGLVTGACLAKVGHTVSCVDIDQEKIKKLKKGIIPIYEPGLDKVVKEVAKKGKLVFDISLKKVLPDVEAIFIAVGTPAKKDGKADLQYVHAVAKEIGENIKDFKVIINKSTVPVGTAKEVKNIILKTYKGKFAVVSNPEFLKEGYAVTDFMKPDRIVIGCDDKQAKKIMQEIYKPVKGKKVFTTVQSAEMIKYASNAFLATKISFINEIANLCEKVNADVKEVSHGMGLDQRIGKSFLSAGIGYGGSCFPKDTSALNQIAGTKGYDFRLLKAVIEVNAKQRQSVIDKLEQIFGNLKNKRIAVLGLAFKNNTDDVRESAAIDIIRMLTGVGARVKAYDPKANDNAKEILNSGVKITNDPYEAIKNADALVIATEWPEFANLDFHKIKNLLKQPIIIDGRNLLNSIIIKKLGFQYYGIGRA
ncbi:MAG: UDP-glucose/GDP-mannose dehydrogenase family protein [Patescibacteria group bacterium]|nr:UDP-glucose/GDP-mannose dehydrogenase family protein [Patescibacteria group bacterium]